MLIYVPLPINMFKFGMFSYMKLSIRGKGKHIFFPILLWRISLISTKEEPSWKKKKENKQHPQCTSVASSIFSIQYLLKSVCVEQFMSISFLIECGRNILSHAINDDMVTAVRLTHHNVKISVSPQLRYCSRLNL